jgi:hypothetical protein
MKRQNKKQKIDSEESCGNAGSVESRKARRRLPTLSTSPLGIPPTPARFPHSHNSGHEADGKLENQTRVSHFPTAANPNVSSKQIERLAAGIRPSPESYSVVVVDREK